MTVEGVVKVTLGVGAATTARYFRINESRAVTAALTLLLLAFWLATAIGVITALIADRKRLLGHAFAILTAAFVLLAAAGPEAHARLRVPIAPILSLFAGLGIARAVRRIAARGAAARVA
jgi:hypothetical protein